MITDSPYLWALEFEPNDEMPELFYSRSDALEVARRVLNSPRTKGFVNVRPTTPDEAEMG